MANVTFLTDDSANQVEAGKIKLVYSFYEGSELTFNEVKGQTLRQLLDRPEIRQQLSIQNRVVGAVKVDGVRVNLDDEVQSDKIYQVFLQQETLG